MPARIQRQRTKGWRMPAWCIYVGRPTVWGNPYAVSIFGAANAVRLYWDSVQGRWSPRTVEQLLPDGIQFEQVYDVHVQFQRKLRGVGGIEAVRTLRGLDLACWCPVRDGVECHADVLLELANA